MNNPGRCLYIEDYATQLCGDENNPLFWIPINQPGFHGKQEGFFRG